VPGGNAVGLTPDTTQYRVKDIARRGDGWANWPDPATPLAVARVVAGLLTTHMNYFRVDVDDPDPISVQVVGNTAYVITK
jgi:hypothetical protein